MRARLLSTCLVAVCCGSSPARAHHGLDFLLVQTAHLPDRGTGYAAVRIDRISSAEHETELEPAMLYGATDRISVELHAHYEKESGVSSRLESVAPALHFRLTPRERAFSVAVSAEYEIAHASEDRDVVEIAAAFGYEGAQWIAAGNLLYERASGASGEWGYAAGVRRTFAAKHGLGLELLGSLESDGSTEMIAAYYREFSERFTFNAGIGAGIDDGPDHSARVALIWRFK